MCDGRETKSEEFEDEVKPYIRCPSYPLNDEFYK